MVVSLGNFYIGTIDNSPEIERECAAALVDGKPAVAYLSGEKLCYQYALSVEALNWSGAVLVDILSGDSLDLEVIGGRPAIAYESYLGSLAYVRAENAGGTSWPAPQIAAYKDLYDIGHGAALADIGGLPAIIYGIYDQVSYAGEIWYTRGDNVDGTFWTLRRQLNTGGIPSRRPALAYIGGMPMAAFESCANDAEPLLRSIRASSADGTWWNDSLPIVSSGVTLSNRESLLKIYDKAAYAYWDETDSKLKLVRARTEDALEFYAPVTVTYAPGTQHSFAFRVINGLPCWRRSSYRIFDSRSYSTFHARSL